MTRREFMKTAGVGVLAVSCAGMLSGCDAAGSIREALDDRDAVSVTIDKVKFMMQTTSVVMNSDDAAFSTIFEIRNNSSETVTIPTDKITGKFYDHSGNEYDMVYTGNTISVEANSDKVRIRDFGLKTTTSVSDQDLKYQKVIVTIEYNGKKAVFTDDNVKNTLTPNKVG